MVVGLAAGCFMVLGAEGAARGLSDVYALAPVFEVDWSEDDMALVVQKLRVVRSMKMIVRRCKCW